MTPADRADEAGLLADVYANPRDPTPRLVYADWCEDHGRPDRAALIRHMLAGRPGPALAMLTGRPGPTVWADLLGAEYPSDGLAVEFDDRARPPFSATPAGVLAVTFRPRRSPAAWAQRGYLHGGFFEGWDLFVTNLLTNLAGYLADSPIRGVRLLSDGARRGRGYGDRAYDRSLWQLDDVGRLECLDLSGYFRGAFDHELFFAARSAAFCPWRWLRELTLPAWLRRESAGGERYWLGRYRDLLPRTDVTFAHEGP